jgi:hypothetical protein
MIGDQGVQRRQPVDPLGEPAAGQPPPVLVDDLDVVMGLGLVIPDEQHSGAASSGSASTCPNPGGEDRGDLMDQCSSARHPTGHPLLLTNRRGHGLSVGLDERTRDTQCSPAGGSDTRSCCRTNRMQPH